MKNWVLAILFLFSGIAKGQVVSKPLVLETSFHSGFNVPVYKALGYLIKDDIFATDIAVGFQSSGKDYWERLFNYPVTGFGFSASTLGNHDILGNAYTVYGFIDIPFRQATGKISFNLHASTGAAYLPASFHISENPLNRAIGSKYNIFFRMGVEGKIRVLPQADIVTGAGLMHFSNGKTRSPNYGINAGTVSLGVTYYFNQEQLERVDPEIPEVERRFINSIFVSCGPKVSDNLFGRRYLSATMSYNIEKFVNHTGKAGLGGDLFYDSSIAEELSENGVTEFSNLVRAGLHASYSLRYKRTIAGIQVGYYLYSKKTVLTRLYNKLYLQHMLSKNITGSISIRSHWGKADGLEYGIGYIW